MGWLDYHLHEFRLLDPTEKQVVSIGIPTDEDPEDRPVIPGWDVPLSRFFERRGWHAPPAMYAYDFGDDWEHVLVHEGLESAEESLTYPRCVSGARRCPPEDCGGVHGYAEFLQAIANRRHPEHRSMLEWAGGVYDPRRVRSDGGRVRQPAEALEEGVRALGQPTVCSSTFHDTCHSPSGLSSSSTTTPCSRAC